MTAQERFAADWNMPLEDVKRMVRLARSAGAANTHACNGDPFPGLLNATKARAAQEWGSQCDAITKHIAGIAGLYGFTDIVYTGLGPTLKRGSQFVEVPY